MLAFSYQEMLTFAYQEILDFLTKIDIIISAMEIPFLIKLNNQNILKNCGRLYDYMSCITIFLQEAIALSEDIRRLEEGDDLRLIYSPILREHGKYPSKDAEGEDYMDLGAAILDFYSSLVDLLAKCAPDRASIQAGKGDSIRARAILRSLISLDDLGHILSLRFTIPNLMNTSTPAPDGQFFLLGVGLQIVRHYGLHVSHFWRVIQYT
jgi:hypothetical protein